jgi:multidrug resistance protein, MATE family
VARLVNSELRPLLRLAIPVVLAEVGVMSMGLVDTLMVGRLGPAAIAATGMGSSVFTAIFIFGTGLMLGIDALVSQSAGAGRPDECLRWLHQGVVLAIVVTPAVMLLTWMAYLTIDAWGLNPEIGVLARPYLEVIVLSAAPLLFWAAFRRYLQGIHVVRPVMWALITANVVNAVGNAILIYGRLGAPALGVTGSAWSTCIARAYLAAFLYVAIRREHSRRGATHLHVPFAIRTDRLRKLLALGAPAASQITLEVGVFALATALAARLDAVSSASHQIALNIVSLTFMVPLGLASAGAVRVGHAVGAGDAVRARRAGWTTLMVGASVMVVLGLLLFAFPAAMLSAFTTDTRVVQIGSRLLAVAAAFQLFDGTQAVTTGVLRGIGDTRTPMVMNVIGHWVLGLPVGYALCFRFGWGVTGLWIGLSIGLIFCAMALTATWIVRTRHVSLPPDTHVPEPAEML